jgi:hypothetical protein
MEEFLARSWDMLWGRSTGPLTIRLILQPTVGALLALRAGLKDAKANRSPYLWSVFTSPELRGELFREGWKDIGKLFVIAALLDVVYQLLVFHWVYPLQALLVALVLSVVPYSVVRGLTTRLARGRATPVS